jgi:hypothetical protein
MKSVRALQSTVTDAVWIEAIPKMNFEVPEDLIQAIELSSFERNLPRQGAPQIHKFLMSAADDDAATAAEEWIENQRLVWPKVDEVVRRLHEVAPMGDKMPFPEWHHQPWWQQLCMPWSDKLDEAVQDANKWCDNRKNGESS